MQFSVLKPCHLPIMTALPPAMSFDKIPVSAYCRIISEAKPLDSVQVIDFKNIADCRVDIFRKLYTTFLEADNSELVGGQRVPINGIADIAYNIIVLVYGYKLVTIIIVIMEIDLTISHTAVPKDIFRLVP